MGRKRRIRLSVPAIFRALDTADDENQILKFDNMLVCMFVSPVMIFCAVINFILRYFVYHHDLITTLAENAVFLAFGIFYEIILRTDGKMRERSKAHLIGAVFGVAFFFAAIRFYDLMGPAIWLFGVIPIMLSMMQSTRMLWTYTGVSMFASWCYITFVSAAIYDYGAYYYAMQFFFFAVLFLVSLAVYRINGNRIKRITGRLNEASEKAEERKRSEETHKQLALYDQLTGLPNRILFFDRLKRALLHADRRGAKIYVLFVDIDLFKMINDTLGHTMGDMLLKKIGDRLTNTVRKSDLVARIGGDEFLIMLQDIESIQDVLSIMKEILLKISDPFIIEQHRMRVSCSIGISKFPDDGEDVEALVKCADLAMYKAKEEGKNRFSFYSQRLTQIVQNEMEMISTMKNALENNEFVLYYQPQINGMTNDVIGFEALIRWNHPTLGLLQPGEFIPLAEKTGLILPIGEWVLKSACAQNKAWQDAGVARVPVSVNISVSQFFSESLEAKIRTVLDETGLDPAYLKLEISEKILARQQQSAKLELERIKSLGIKISIDDFGTGYSSFYYLKQFPIDQIKIPMAFIKGIDRDMKDESIISVILGVAESLDMEVIAEGVETKKQVDFLKSRLCKKIQGFYYSRPLMPDEIKKYCKETPNAFIGV